jgi:hypothetical protein
MIQNGRGYGRDDHCLDDREVAKLDRLLNDLTLYERGRSIMEVLLGQVGVQRRNPIEIRANAFRPLLWPNGEAPQNWKRDVEAVLTSLSHVKFILRGGGIKAKGVFLASYITNDEDNPNRQAFRYMPRGRGGMARASSCSRCPAPSLGVFASSRTPPLA